MIKRLLLSLLVAAVLGSTGCHYFHKSRKPKESSALASETEVEFKQRWMAKRLAELAQQGVTGPAAQQQADQEFKDKFSFAVPARK